MTQHLASWATVVQSPQLACDERGEPVMWLPPTPFAMWIEPSTAAASQREGEDG